MRFETITQTDGTTLVTLNELHAWGEMSTAPIPVTDPWLAVEVLQYQVEVLELQVAILLEQVEGPAQPEFTGDWPLRERRQPQKGPQPDWKRSPEHDDPDGVGAQSDALVMGSTR